jgi:HEPN domain-containing protein
MGKSFMPLHDKTQAYWNELALHDSRTVETLLRENGYPEIIIYHMHQAVEKILKGRLVAAGIVFPYIHDLERLFKILIEKESNLRNLEKEIILMQSYYLDMRYPQADWLNADDVKKAKAVYDILVQALGYAG